MQKTNYKFELKNLNFKFQVKAITELNSKWFKHFTSRFPSETKISFKFNSFKKDTGATLLRKSLITCLLFTINFHGNSLMAQCSSCIGAAACSGGNGVVSNGTNINVGETYYYSSSGSLGSGINLNGGTLRICGSLTLSGINFNSGNIVVEAGGSLTINGGGTLYLNGNSRIYNRGTLNINRNLAMQNNNNLLNNCSSSAILNMNSGSHMFEINNSSSYFINLGTANIHTLFLQSNAPNNAVCLGAGSSMLLTNLNNNKTNGINAPSGNACIRYTSNAALNSNLSNSSNVIICRASGSTTSGGAGFGSASVNVNCTSCLTALPVSLIDFKAQCNGNETIIEWKLSNDENSETYTIEKSYDGKVWFKLKEIKASEQLNSINNYSIVEENENRLAYYRLLQKDINGRTTQFENTITNSCVSSFKSFSVFPNPSNQTINIELKNPGNDHYIVIVNTKQEKMFESKVKVDIINVEHLVNGIYFLIIDGEVSKIVIEH